MGGTIFNAQVMLILSTIASSLGAEALQARQQILGYASSSSVGSAASSDPDHQPWIGESQSKAIQRIADGPTKRKLIARAVSIVQNNHNTDRTLRGGRSSPLSSEQRAAIKKAEHVAIAVAKEREKHGLKSAQEEQENASGDCTNVVFTGNGPSTLMGVYSVQKGKYNGGPYYKCGKAYLYRMSGEKGWAIGSYVGSNKEAMYSQASGDLQMSLTDKYTMWSERTGVSSAGIDSPHYQLVRNIQVNCFEGSPLKGYCDAGDENIRQPSSYTSGLGSTGLGNTGMGNYAGIRNFGAASAASMDPVENEQLQLQTLRLRQQQSMQQASIAASEQQALRQATLTEEMEEQKQAKLRRQMLMRNCLRQYETEPMLLQTCLAQVQQPTQYMPPPPLFP